jgi:hypothetical protein
VDGEKIRRTPMRYVTIYARNIVNLKSLDGRIKTAIQRIRSEEGKKWFKSNLRKWMINNYPHVEEIGMGDLEDPILFPNGHPDWVIESLNNGIPLYKIIFGRDMWMVEILELPDYFNSLDERQLKKLSRVSVPDAIAAQKKWHEELHKDATLEEEDGKDTVTIREMENGYRWVRCLTKQALDREGLLMNHCVGSYAEVVEMGRVEIYSLRDPKNLPHVTIEYDAGNRYINQIKGKNNKRPIKKYHPYIVEFFRDPPFDVIHVMEGDDIFGASGVVFVTQGDRGGKLMDWENIPPNSTVCSFDMRSLSKSAKKFKNFPEGLTVMGSVIMTGPLPFSEIKDLSLEDDIFGRSKFELHGANMDVLQVKSKNIKIERCKVDRLNVDTPGARRFTINMVLIHESTVRVLRGRVNKLSTYKAKFKSILLSKAGKMILSETTADKVWKKISLDKLSSVGDTVISLPKLNIDAVEIEGGDVKFSPGSKIGNIRIGWHIAHKDVPVDLSKIEIGTIRNISDRRILLPPKVGDLVMGQRGRKVDIENFEFPTEFECEELRLYHTKNLPSFVKCHNLSFCSPECKVLPEKIDSKYLSLENTSIKALHPNVKVENLQVKDQKFIGNKTALGPLDSAEFKGLWPGSSLPKNLNCNQLVLIGGHLRGAITAVDTVLTLSPTMKIRELYLAHLIIWPKKLPRISRLILIDHYLTRGLWVEDLNIPESMKYQTIKYEPDWYNENGE